MTAPYRLQRSVPHSIRDERHNLPTSLSSFIGRERELTEVQARLAGARLVTLTGGGGCLDLSFHTSSSLSRTINESCSAFGTPARMPFLITLRISLGAS